MPAHLSCVCGSIYAGALKTVNEQRDTLRKLVSEHQQALERLCEAVGAPVPEQHSTAPLLSREAQARKNVAMFQKASALRWLRGWLQCAHLRYVRHN